MDQRSEFQPSPDTWSRLAQLELTCQVQWHSTMDTETLRKAWIVTVSRRDRDEAYEVRGDWMSEAIQKAIVMAEAKGWL